MARRPTRDAGSCHAALRELGFSGDRAVSDFQREWRLPATNILEATTIALIVEVHEAHQIGARHKQKAPCHAVEGRVADGKGAPAPDLEVQLIERRFRSETKRATTHTDGHGRYQAPYPRAVAKAKNAIVVRVLDGGKVVVESAPQFTLPPLLTVDLTVDASHARPPSEFQTIHAAVTARVDKVAIADLSATDVTFLAGAIDFSTSQLTQLIVAYKLAAKHPAIDPAFFYALFREGTLLGATASPAGARFAVDLSTPLDPLYFDLVLADEPRLRAGVSQAIADRIVGTSVERELSAIIAELAKSREAAEQYRNVQQPQQLLAAVVANLAAGKHQELLAAITGASGGDPQAIADRIAGIQLVGDDGGTAGKLIARLLAAQPSLLSDLQTLSGLAGGSPAAKSASSPTATFLAQLEAAAAADAPPHRDAMVAALKAKPGFDLARGSVADLLRSHPGLTPAARDQLRATRRVFKLAPNYAQTKLLLDAGIHSASQIAALGESQFVKRFTASGAFSPSQARATFHRAADVSAAAGFLAGDLLGITGGGAAAMMPDALAKKLELVARDNPNLKTLFQLQDLCACASCNAIDSPAAYLVDVMQFLDARLVTDTTVTPVDTSMAAIKVLRGRRPDLLDIDLSCDNTNVPLPYIDVVCELLEQAVAPDPGIPFSGAVAPGVAPPALVSALVAKGLDFTSAAFIQSADADGNLAIRDAKALCKLVPGGAPNTWTACQLRQTFRSADQLAAMPEYVDDAAYAILQSAQIAFALPYDLYHEEARAYFTQFGIGRDGLMSALGAGGSPDPHAVAADALDIASVEHDLIVTPRANATDQGTYWNTGATDPATKLNNVDTFLTFTGLSYADLQTLLQRSFINPSPPALFIQHLDASCDTAKQRIAGLDEAALDRIHRFLRLKNHGFEMVALDRAIGAARIGAGTLGDDFLVQLAALAKAQSRFGIALDELVSWYGTISTENGVDSRYAKIFLDAATVGSVDPALAIDAVQGNPGAATPLSLSSASDALATALGISSTDLATLISALTVPPMSAPALNATPLPNDVLSFASLAALYGQVSLARVLNAKISDLVLLEQLFGINPLASPAETLRFLVEWDKVAASGMAAADLRWYLQFPSGDAGRTLPDATITTLLGKTQAALQAAFTKNQSPFDATLSADENEGAVVARVGQLPGVSPTQLGQLRSVLENAWVLASPTAQQVLDGILAPFPIATTAIDTSLAALLSLPSTATDAQIDTARKQLLSDLSDAVCGYLYGLARVDAVTSTVVSGLALDEALAGVLLAGAHPGGGSPFLVDILGADGLIDKIGNPPVPPALTPAAFAPQYAAIRLLRQMATFAATLKPLAAADLAWLLAHDDALGWLEIDRLPVKPGDPTIDYSKWSALRSALDLIARYPAVADPASATGEQLAFTDLFALPTAGGKTIAELSSLAAIVAGWSASVVTDLHARFGFAADLADYKEPATWLRVEAAVVALRVLGLSVADGVTLTADPLDAGDTALLRKALKARYAEADWLGVLQQIYDPLRQQKRDALVAWLLANNPDFSSSDDLFDYFLVDVEMCACQPTSRIVSAHGSLQLFAQRCLLGIEPTAVADTAEDSGWKQWQWMEAYRTWQANRQVFLYPENWTEPALRDDKSEPYQALEDALQQSNLDPDSITTATNGYLEALDQIAFLEVVSTYYQQSTYTLHIFARTKGGDPPTYFHRTLVQEKMWTPWERVDLDIKGDHLISFVRDGRLYLAWPIFTATPNPNPTATVPDSTPNTTVSTETDQQWQIQIALSQLSNGQWTPSVTSQQFVAWPPQSRTTPLVDKSFFRFVPLDLRSGGFMILATINGGDEDRWIGGFTLDGCKGYPGAFQVQSVYDTDWIALLFLPLFAGSDVRNERFTEHSAAVNKLSIFTFIARAWVDILDKTPDQFRVTWPQQLGLIDYILWLLQLLEGAKVNRAPRDQALERRWWAIPLGTFMPYFYEDGNHQYVAIPGFYAPGDAANGQSAAPTRKTISDVLAMLQLVILLAERFFQLLAQTPGDLPGVWQAFWSDPAVRKEWQKLLEDFAGFSGTRYGVEFDNHYHPLCCSLRKTLYASGIDALLARDTQLQTTSFDFKQHYAPQIVTQPYPSESIEFGRDDSYPVPAYASYNWELFFHMPFEVATRLSAAQQYETAMEWYHYIFNPMDATAGAVPQKYWRTKPFFQRTSAEYASERIDSIMNGLDTASAGDLDNLKTAVEQWRKNPYEPFVVARARTVALQQTILMHYLDNLIAWGDSLFTQGTMESVNQATQLYILADKLLGPKPRVVPPLVTPPTETYNQLKKKSIDVFGNAMLQLEDLIPDLSLLPEGGAELPPPPLTYTSLYFCIPPNPKMMGYWDTVADRLFKIRHCQDINGVERTLALFAPPIDPGALVAAAAAGLSPSQILAGLSAPLPFYRFNAVVQKATELTQMVSSFGQQILSALEKRDGEALSRLRATQEVAVQKATLAVKQQQLADAQSQLDVLQKGIDVTTAKSKYYHAREFMNAGESAALALNQAAIGVQTAATGMDAAAAAMHLLPSFSVGVAGFGGSPSFNASFGGDNIAGALSGFSSVVRSIGGLMQSGAGISSTLAGYARRQDDWEFQAQQADLELVQMKSQVAQAKIRVQVAEAELAQQRLQLANAQQSSQFLAGKFTNKELYDHLLSRLASVYFTAYQTALDVAHKAERCFQHELGTDKTIIGYGYWDGLHKGLLAGDLLLADLRRLELAYLEGNRREYELTKSVSLAMLDPAALLSLQNAGTCTFSLPEALFDLDHPGQYFRRLRTVSLTIPCVAGPYASVSAKLSIVGNRYRKLPSGAYNETPAGGDARFVYNVGTIQSIATSQGQSDSGLFQLDFKDERYLPFEGQGAISSWRIDLPNRFRQFDYQTITDVVLTLKYTARDGGSGLRTTVETQLGAALQAMAVDKGVAGLYQSVNVRRELSDAWFRLRQTGSVGLKITADMLPGFSDGHSPAILSARWFARVSGDPSSFAMSLAVGGGGATGFSLSTSPVPKLLAASSPAFALGDDLTLAATGAAKLEELSLVVGYTLGS
jgi:hypothetical protein